MVKTSYEAKQKTCPLNQGNYCLADECGVWVWSILAKDYERETGGRVHHVPTAGRINDEDCITFEKGASGNRYEAGPAKGYCGLAMVRKP